MTIVRDRLVDDYLKRLSRATRGLPAGRRRELLDEIADHLDEAAADAPSEVEVRNVLERLGPPEEIAAEERLRLGIEPARAGWREGLAVPLLLIGGVFVPVLGWLAGVALLWLSRVWTPRDKLLGTLIVPGGLLPVLILGLTGTSVQTCYGTVGPAPGATSEHCTGGGVNVPLTIVAVLLLVAPIAMAIYLGVQAHRRSSAF